MADIQKLAAELTADPTARGYAGMDDAAAAVSLNAVDRVVNRESVPGDEIFNAADVTELEALATGTDAQKQLFQMFLSLCGRDAIDPFGTANERLVRAVFGAGSASLGNLAALRTDTISRAAEVGLGDVRVGDVTAARAFTP